MKKTFKAFGSGFARVMDANGFWLGYNLIGVALFTGFMFWDAGKGNLLAALIDAGLIVMFAILAVHTVKEMIGEMKMTLTIKTREEFAALMERIKKENN